MADLLSRVAYRKVLKGLEHYKKQHDEDRLENPHLIPSAWGMCLRLMIEDVVRQTGGRVHKGLADQVLDYLVEKKMLVHYVGDYTFPSEEPLPTFGRTR